MNLSDLRRSCERCGGSGGRSPQTCSECNGHGLVPVTAADLEGEKIDWCVKHGGQKFYGYPWCQKAANADNRQQIPPCVFVERLLIPISDLDAEIAAKLDNLKAAVERAKHKKSIPDPQPATEGM